jgi:hypothetical protein
MKKVFVLLGFAAAVIFVANAQALRITTNDPGGADCELREEAPAANRGTSSEIASRLYVYPSNPTDSSKSRNSMIYLKFGVADVTAADLLGDINVQTTFRNTNLAVGRYRDTVEPIGPNTGWDFFVLDPTMEGANWSETTITPSNAPGYFLDGDYSTKGIYDPFMGGLNPGVTYLGTQLYDDQYLRGGHLSVGGRFTLVNNPGSALHDAIVAAQATDHKTVTVIMTIAHEWDSDNTQWINFNYLFNPKEMLTLNNDPTSSWGGASNAYGKFSPALTSGIPEPATMALLGLGGLLLRRKR